MTYQPAGMVQVVGLANPQTAMPQGVISPSSQQATKAAAFSSGVQRDYTADAEVLYTAMKGLGTDEDRLIAILGNRTRQELQLIDNAYRAKYGKLLVDKIRSETSGNFQRVLVNIVQPPEMTDASYLYESMKGVGTDEVILNEIMGTRDGAEFEKIKMAFVSMFRTGSEKAIKGDTSGKYEKLLLTLHNGPRGKGETGVDGGKVAADAQKLYESPTEVNFTYILGNSSHAHNLAIRDVFQQRYGKSIVDVIKKQFSGNFEDLLVLLVTPRAEYFAERAYKAMKGMGTDDEALIRIITTRHGVDLPAIKQVFLQRYHKSLYEWVKSETSGDYRKIMLAVIGEGM